MSLSPGHRLSHYRVLEQIGAGGMGVIFRARDENLERDVALKVLPPGLLANENARWRFRKEALALSRLNHPNVAAVYDFGSENGADFIVMELVPGETLSEKLRSGPLPENDVLELGRQLADGLAAAHREGIVHRDLKPANLRITPEGRLKILDFGLAKIVREATEASQSELHSQGVVGTLPYMAPEQLRQGPVDRRTDVYGAGAVLYEMAAGVRCFDLPDTATLLYAIVHGEPRKLRGSNSKVSPALETVILKCIEKDPGNRYASAEELGKDLERLGAGMRVAARRRLRRSSRVLGWSLGIGVLAVAIAVWTTSWLLRSSTRSAASAERTIVILPMEIRGQTDDAEFVGRAFAEAIAVNLAQSKELTVLPVSQPNEPGPGGGRDPIGTARKAGAGRLLTGALTRDGSTFHAMISLIDSDRNRLVWGSQQDTDGTSLGALAVTFAREIAAQVGAAPSFLYDVIPYTKPSPRLAASSEFADVQAAWRGAGRVGLQEATQRLVAAFPDDVLAHAWRLFALANRAFGRAPSAPERRAYEEEASVLARLDSRQPYGDWFRGVFEREDGHLRDSVATLSQIVARDDLTPAVRSTTLASRALSLSRLGEQEAALADIRAAVALDPLFPEVHWFYSLVLDNSRRYEEGLASIRHAEALSPGRGWPGYGIQVGYFLYRLGRWKESIEFVEPACPSAVESSGTTAKIRPERCALLAMALHRDGQLENSKKAAEKAAAAEPTGQGLWYLAAYRLLTHERAKALDLLGKAVDLGAVSSPAQLSELETGQDFADLREEPVFKKLVEEARKRIEK